MISKQEIILKGSRLGQVKFQIRAMYIVFGSIRVLEVMVDRMSPFRDCIKEDCVQRILYGTKFESCAL
jgi:hypothetical protein